MCILGECVQIGQDTDGSPNIARTLDLFSDFLQILKISIKYYGMSNHFSGEASAPSGKN